MYGKLVDPCTWCSSVEFENITSFSCFYHATQITRISLVSLTHTARKSPENQCSNVDSIVTSKLEHRYGKDIRFATERVDSLHDLSDCMGTDVFGDVETQGVPSLEAVGYERFQRDGEQQN